MVMAIRRFTAIETMRVLVACGRPHPWPPSHQPTAGATVHIWVLLQVLLHVSSNKFNLQYPIQHLISNLQHLMISTMENKKRRIWKPFKAGITKINNWYVRFYELSRWLPMSLTLSLCSSGQSSTWLVNQIVKNKSENPCQFNVGKQGLNRAAR